MGKEIVVVIRIGGGQGASRHVASSTLPAKGISFSTLLLVIELFMLV